MMKRMLALLLAMLMLLSLVGCGEQGIEAPNGEVLKETKNYGIPTFGFAGTTIPVGLGLPELTDEEIDALLEENDPRKVKETITTLADFVNYCYRGEFGFGSGLIGFFDKETGNEIAQPSCSGYQTILRREGQCASMSSCLHYVLACDYEEVGYVKIDGHAMVYILCDGLYYLINPVEYVYNINMWTNRWLGQLPSEGTYCSSDFQEIADSLLGSIIGTKITMVYTATSPGDLVGHGSRQNAFAKGMDVTRWYGEPVEYIHFTNHDWISQESIVDEKFIVETSEDPETHFLIDASVHSSEKNTVEEYLKEIGAITFTNAELTALVETEDLDEISRVITTAEDCVQLIVSSGITAGDNGSIEAAFAKKILWPDRIVEMACRVLEGDYEEVGMITTLPDNYFFLYVKQDGIYTIYDTLRATWGEGDGKKTFDSSEAMVEYAITERGDSDATISTWPW